MIFLTLCKISPENRKKVKKSKFSAKCLVQLVNLTPLHWCRLTCEKVTEPSCTHRLTSQQVTIPWENALDCTKELHLINISACEKFVPFSHAWEPNWTFSHAKNASMFASQWFFSLCRILKNVLVLAIEVGWLGTGGGAGRENAGRRGGEGMGPRRECRRQWMT